MRFSICDSIFEVYPSLLKKAQPGIYPHAAVLNACPCALQDVDGVKISINFGLQWHSPQTYPITSNAVRLA